jgi:hypothetical protein
MEICVMGIKFEGDWNHEGKHIIKKETATALIKSAAEAVGKDDALMKHAGISIWQTAVNSDLSNQSLNQISFVNVEKNDHQFIGLINREAHITMRVCIQTKFEDREHSMYKGAFHLDMELPDPLPGAKKQKLIPIKISYLGIDKQITVFDIANAAAVDSDA